MIGKEGEAMKKIYIKPNTDTVNVHLHSSVLDEAPYGKWSQGAAGGDEPGWGDAKENNLDFGEDFGDIWGEGDNSSNPYDLWGE